MTKRLYQVNLSYTVYVVADDALPSHRIADIAITGVRDGEPEREGVVTTCTAETYLDEEHSGSLPYGDQGEPERTVNDWLEDLRDEAREAARLASERAANLPLPGMAVSS